MAWSIGTVLNTVVVPEAVQDKLIELVESEGHYISFNKDGTIQFCDDAMEHMDFLWDPDVQILLESANTQGVVVFSSVEGDNAGDFWGYKFHGDKTIQLSKKESLQHLIAAVD
jgi:hypothetical protein